MNEDYMIRNCAPTLAGLKTGSMFTCPVTDRQSFLDALRDLNLRLKDKGLRSIPLRFSDRRALVYVYRPSHLRRDLDCGEARSLLCRQGYEPGCCEKCVAHLIRKLRQQEDFPHEIGLFLGYPPEDVRGFMDQGPDCCKCTGCWKVYGDEDAAKKKFAQYKKCTRVYCDRWAKNRDIERLTVAG